MKNLRIPYKKYRNILFVKKIDYNLKNRYKKVTYVYEVYNNGDQINEVIHKDKYPAIVIYGNNKILELQYWKHGKKHREHGPSLIRLDNKHNIIYEEWYINDIKLNDQEIEDTKKVIDRRKKMYKVILKMKSKN